MTRARCGPASIGSLDHLRVRERRGREPSPSVGHERHAAHAGAGPVRRDRLHDRGHAHRVGAEVADHAYLRGCLVGGAGEAQVDTLGERHVLGSAGCVEARAQLPIPDFGHVRKAGPQDIVIGTHQRVAAGEVDVVAHDHQGAGSEGRVDAARGIGEQQDGRTESAHQQRGFHHQTLGQAFVHVQAATETGDRQTAQDAKDEASAMAGNRWRRPAGHLLEGDLDRDPRSRRPDRRAPSPGPCPVAGPTRKRREHAPRAASSRWLKGMMGSVMRGGSCCWSSKGRPRRSTRKCPERPPRPRSALM